ncbi:MAG TPA: ZIP family metal transporter [Kofleriaceae bacterium]|nr:ZIP family metal transporter [Kofleriaceae bacterium]
MTVLWVAIAITLDGAAALVGGLLPDAWLTRHRSGLMGFAVGALLAAAALDLAPEAFALAGIAAVPWLAAGFVAMAVLEVLVHAHGHHLVPRSAARGLHDTGALPHEHVVPYALLGSDALHNFGDGMAIAAAFLVSPRLGAVTSFAVIIHELPEELADYAVLRTAGLAKWWSLVALAIVQLTAGLGAAAVLLGVQVSGEAAGLVLALAAGTFAWIAVVDLAPAAVRGQPPRARLAALAGCAIGFAAIWAAT